MKIFETTFIVNPQADDATIDRQVNAVAEVIQNNNGRIIKSNRIGTRRLAYPIQNLTQGYYADFIFESEPDVLPKIERLFKLEDAYIRHLLIRFDGDPRWLEEESGEESRERPAAGPQEREESAERRPAMGGRRPEPEEAKEATRTEAEKKAPEPEEAIPPQPAPVKEPDESVEPEPQTPTADEVPGVPEKKEEASEEPAEEKAEAEEEDKEKREKIAGEGDEL